jgi:hypothetical protein
MTQMQGTVLRRNIRVSANDDSKLRREVVYSVGSFEAFQLFCRAPPPST